MGEKTEVEEPMRHEANLQHWTSTEEPRRASERDKDVNNYYTFVFSL